MAEAIDYTNKLDKALTIVKSLQTVAEQLMSAMEKYTELKTQINAGGFVFTEYNPQYAEQTGLKHVDGDTINSVISGFAGITDWFDAKDENGISLYRRDPFNKFRTGA
jgi:hypothetical protein